MLTINETADKAGLARHFVRQLVLNNSIVHVKAGCKFLINWERFVDYLNSGEPAKQEHHDYGKIRRLYG
jgi:hypothetical protein